MTKMAIIASDPVIRNELRSLIGKCDPECRVIEEAGSIADALPLLANLSPDALLLDADLPDGSGFDLLDALNMESPHQVIIMAEAPNAACRASGYNVVEFMLKPIRQATLSRALGKLHHSGSSDDLPSPSPTTAFDMSAIVAGPLDTLPVRKSSNFVAERQQLPKTEDWHASLFDDNGKRIIFYPFPW